MNVSRKGCWKLAHAGKLFYKDVLSTVLQFSAYSDHGRFVNVNRRGSLLSNGGRKFS